MAMIVQRSEFSTPDSSYAVGFRITHEPKTSFYEVNCYINGEEVERAYFGAGCRDKATAWAGSWQMEHWLKYQAAMAPHQHRYDEDGLCVVCGEDIQPDDEPSTEPEPVDRYGRRWDERYEDVREFGHLSNDPHKCGCGDCMAYLAGEQY